MLTTGKCHYVVVGNKARDDKIVLTEQNLKMITRKTTRGNNRQ